MNIKHFFYPLIVFVFNFAFLISISFSQDGDSIDINFKSYSAVITKNDSVINLLDKFLIENSVILIVDSLKISRTDYRIDSRFGKLFLYRNLINQIFSDSLKPSADVKIFYKNYPFDLPDVYSKFKVLTKLDTLKEDSVQVAEVKSDFIEDIFAGSELEKSGNIFRGFTIGNNRDLTLNSGFRLQMNGKLSRDIDIVAALTDENTPIQPEGNTQKLQEVDKVFVELRSKNITTTLGDIDVNFSKLEFFNFSRKVQGAKGLASFDFSEFFVSAALSRGRFNTNNFNGIDGVQGPYKLVGLNNEINIVVISGSEKVYLDGVLMFRGETNDYTIDYSNGQVTFTNRRLITNASRIIVDFEYSDKKYSRSLISGQTKTSLFNDKLKLSLSFIREKDDRDKPIDFILSDADRQIIANAGDDKFKASKSGVNYVGYDSLTGAPLGQYIKVDTLINSNPFTFYRYKSGDTLAVYQVTFAFVGSGKGDYISLSTTTFKFIGIGQGSYLPIVFFPLPLLYQSGDLDINLELSKSFSLNVETAVSDFDRNLFSSNDDTENKGLALNSSLTFNKDKLRIGSLNLGRIEVLLRQRFINKLYNSIDRLNRVEYNRVWDIQDSSRQTENTSEAELKLVPKEYLTVSALGGHIKRGSNFNSLRGSLNIDFIGDSVSLPVLNYYADYISSRDNTIDYKGIWIRQKGTIDYKIIPWRKKFGTYNFIFQLKGEDKQAKSLNSDTALIGSFRYYEFIPKFIVTSFFNFDFSYRFIYRFDDLYNAGSLTRQSNSLTHNYSIRIKDLNFLSSVLDLIVYDKKYTDVFHSKGFIDSRTILVNSQTNLWFFNRAFQTNLFYKLSSERTAKSEVVFIKVPIGQGNYIYLGDLNGNGVQDENEFQLVNFDGDYIKLLIPTDQLFPTSDLQTSANININPSRILNISLRSILKKIINNISFDTYLAVSERSKDSQQKNIYLLKFSKFQNEINTITGSNTIQQDINLFENNEYFAVRLRFIQKRSFNQYFSGNERLLNIERSARLRLSFTADISLQTDYVNKVDRNFAPSLSTRNRNIKGNSVISDLSYRPYKNVEVGFKLELSRNNDFYPVNTTQADINIQNLIFSYSLENKGRLRTELERNEAILNTSPFFVPYELTGGKAIGKNYLWTVSLDYRITSFIQATVNYFGRAEGKSKVIHTGTAELRAYF